MREIHYVCEAISGYFVALAWNCLACTLYYIAMQMRKTKREKAYYEDVGPNSLLITKLTLFF